MGPRSQALLGRARDILPGGVSSPVRSHRGVGGDPVVVQRADGAYVIDEDGTRYLDMILAYGPHILGHGHPRVVEAVAEQLSRGTAFGTTTAAEVELAERIRAAMPSLEMLRFVNSGTEATMSAVRLARAATGRSLVVTFSGGYHGHADLLLADAGSGLATFAIPASPGVPAGAVADTASLAYNDVAAVGELFAERGPEIACILVEPVAGNMGCVPPQPGFLQTLRDLTHAHGAVLIFDEVMTGFRVAHGGAQQRFGISPDLTCLGKVIGGGLPVGAYGGRRDLMEQIAPAGPVYQAGTLSGNPLAMAAGNAVLAVLADSPDLYERLETLGARLEAGLRQVLPAPSAVNRVGSMLTAFVGSDPVVDFAGAKRADTAAFARLHARWLEAGVLWPPSQFESGFLSTAHTEADVDAVVTAAGRLASEAAVISES